MKINKIIAFLLPQFLFLSCSDLFQSKIAMTENSNGTNLENLVKDTVVKTKLDSPLQVYVSNGYSSSDIYITWASVENAKYYRLERAVATVKNSAGTFDEPDEGDYEIIKLNGKNSSSIYDNNFTDTILSSPNYKNQEFSFAYFYRISAENPYGGYESSEYSDAKYGTLFSPPTNIFATSGTSTTSITITWSKSSSEITSSYLIYRTSSINGSGKELVQTISSNMDHYKDEISEENQGKTFYYSVYAKNSNGTLSCESSIGSGYARLEGSPSQVTNVQIIDGNGRGNYNDKIVLRWNKDSDASVFYALYRNSSADSSYTLLSQKISSSDSSFASLDSSGIVYCDSSNLKPSIYYYYFVQSWKYKTEGDETSEKLMGSMSDSGSSSITPAEGFILGPPETLSVIKGNSSNTIYWTPAQGTAEEQEKYSYSIFGDTTSDGDFSSSISSANASDLIISNDEYCLQISNEYSFYKIKTTNGTESSAFSSVTAPSPFAPQTISASKYSNFSSEVEQFTSNANGVYPVKISWTAPSVNNDVAGYYVYRSTKSDSGFRKLSLNNDESTYLISDTKFYDSYDSAKTKKIYYYKVLSVNSLGQGTNYSDVSFGYGALTADQYMREYNITIMASQKKLTLMHKSANTDKLGSEQINGNISGTLSYNACVSGTSGVVTMHYADYCDYYVSSTGALTSASDGTSIGTKDGMYFFCNGNTNTSANMNGNGEMNGTVTCSGMYPGTVNYDNIEIKNSGAGGGTYVITRDGFAAENVSYTVGNE